MARFKQTHATPSNTWYVEPSGRWHLMPLALACICGAIFVLLLAAVLAAGKGAIAIDLVAQSIVVDGMRSDVLTPIMVQFTSIALPTALVVGACALTIFTDGPLVGAVAALNVGLGWLVNHLIKHIVERPRPPEELRLAVETSTSFPSGHSITAMLFYGFLIWLVWHYQRNNVWRNIQIAIFAVAIILVGLSRIYLGVHYLSDVLAGYCVGVIWLVLFTRYVAPRLLELSPSDLGRQR